MTHPMPQSPITLRALAPAHARLVEHVGTEPLRVVADHAPLAYERHQELALDAPSRPVQVQGHATMVELILRNLVDNALRHTPPGTLVEVRVAQTPQGTCTLSVSDNGARDGAQVSANPGMGVGLNLVQRMADALCTALRLMTIKNAFKSSESHLRFI